MAETRALTCGHPFGDYLVLHDTGAYGASMSIELQQPPAPAGSIRLTMDRRG